MMNSRLFMPFAFLLCCFLNIKSMDLETLDPIVTEIITINSNNYSSSIKHLNTSKDGRFQVEMDDDVTIRFLYEVVSAQRLPQSSPCHYWTQEKLKALNFKYPFDEKVDRNNRNSDIVKKNLEFNLYYLSKLPFPSVAKEILIAANKLFDSIQQDLQKGTKTTGEHAYAFLEVIKHQRMREIAIIDNNRSRNSTQSKINETLPWQLLYPFFGSIHYQCIVIQNYIFQRLIKCWLYCRNVVK